jgi:trimethylamine-N-oxide reductase cytochrome c-type subunit TorC
MWQKLASQMWSGRALVLVGAVGLIAGVVGWGGFNTIIEATNNLNFCISCHEMRDTVYQEYKKSIHYSNPAGVRAVCSDCHVPKDWTHKIVRKIQASQEVWGKLTGSINTPEKFEAKRLVLARQEWARMKAADSRECRNCHSFEAMDFAHQRPESSKQMQKAMKEGSTCIDCHKGIAHKLPDMSSGYRAMYEDIVAYSASAMPNAGSKSTTLATKPFWLERPSSESASVDGRLLALTPLDIIERDGSWVKVKVSGWQQEGAERVFYAQQGKRILAAALSNAAVATVTPGHVVVDSDTDQKWTEASVVVWTTAKDLVSDPKRLDAYGQELFNSACGLCHAAPPLDHYLANQWIGTLDAMKRNVSMDDEEFRFLQKWVQLHAKDTGGHNES